MADYVVGDIQGCFDSLISLLDQVNFNPKTDTLYCVGDLVNRGPKSLETLRFLKSLGNSVKPVLGNHDLHLISCYYGVREFKRNDTANAILNADDAEELILWLRELPLAIYIAKSDVFISHAGLYPAWSINKGLKYAKVFEKALKSDKYMNLLRKMYGNTPNKFSKLLSTKKKWLFTVNVFTRMRYCYKDASLDFKEKSDPATNHKKSVVPWFQLPNKRDENTRFIFGHWSSLGLYNKKNIIGLDTGCVWGQKMTLYDIGKDKFIQQKAID